MSDYLTHYGVLGMKWGVRRYQNKDGTLTSLGKRRTRGAGIAVGITKKRTLAYAKRDLERLNKGEHLSIGLTKSRQQKYDERDLRKLESIINDPEKINNGKLYVNKLLASRSQR